MLKTVPFRIGYEEDLMSLKELAELPEIKNARITYFLLRDWVYRGINGHKLDLVRVGGRRYTTVARVLDYAVKVGGEQREKLESAKLTTTSKRQVEQDKRELEAMLYKTKPNKHK